MRKLVLLAGLVLVGCSYQTTGDLRFSDGKVLHCGALELQTSAMNTLNFGGCDDVPKSTQVSVWPGTSVGKAALDAGTAVTGAAAFAVPFAYTANGGHF